MAEPPACPGGTCELFGVFGILVQCLIGVWCVATLLVMWWLETPRRSLLAWLGDMSKQMVGAGYGHFMNVGVAILFGEALTTAAANNQCVWYLVGFLSDIFFSTFLCWLLTTALRPVFRRNCGIDIGEYKDDANLADGQASMSPWLMWSLQTAIWLGILTVVKAVVSLGVYLAQEPLYSGLASLFRQVNLCHHQRAQLVVSVVLVPIVGDAFQFAVQDSFLKNNVATATTKEEVEMEMLPADG
eukprot:TRINITY_DN20028_c0_g1_i1.p1 TRINITY_DN20028_c0_g1~~TRINITY_DN20028_c0_g1_i1.p1  ORF type:complete len:252 (-),score=38.73 TRINITY_DN20028_c0_g1_i1:61-789(-)